MQAVIKLKVEELTTEFVDNLKKLFAGKQLEITVETEDELDATEYIINNPAYAKELQRRINSIENKTAKLVDVKVDELI